MLATEALAFASKPEMRCEPAPLCDLCGSTGALAYTGLPDHFHNVAGTFNLRRCDNPECGVLWLDPRPLEADIHLAYQSYYTHGTAESAVEVSRSVASSGSPIQWLRSGAHRAWKSLLHVDEQRADVQSMFLRGVKPGRLLEVGCGDGARLAHLRAMGWHSRGQEIDERAAQRAEDRGLQVFVGQLEKAAFEPGSFDAVVMNHVIEHLHTPAALMAESARILAPGGILVVITPNPESFGLRYFGRNWHGLDAPRHIHIFTLGSLAALARSSGLERPRTFSTSARAQSVARGSYAFALDSAEKEPALRRNPLGPQAKAALFQTWAIVKVRSHPQCGEENVLWVQK